MFDRNENANGIWTVFRTKLLIVISFLLLHRLYVSEGIWGDNLTLLYNIYHITSVFAV